MAAITSKKLVCPECGVKFDCQAGDSARACWCMKLPNMRGGFDLAGDCVCPDCLTQGQAKAITRQRKHRQGVRAANAIR